MRGCGHQTPALRSRPCAAGHALELGSPVGVRAHRGPQASRSGRARWCSPRDEAQVVRVAEPSAGTGSRCCRSGRAGVQPAHGPAGACPPACSSRASRWPPSPTWSGAVDGRSRVAGLGRGLVPRRMTGWAGSKPFWAEGVLQRPRGEHALAEDAPAEPRGPPRPTAGTSPSPPRGTTRHTAGTCGGHDQRGVGLSCGPGCEELEELGADQDVVAQRADQLGDVDRLVAHPFWLPGDSSAHAPGDGCAGSSFHGSTLSSHRRSPSPVPLPSSRPRTSQQCPSNAPMCCGIPDFGRAAERNVMHSQDVGAVS